MDDEIIIVPKELRDFDLYGEAREIDVPGEIRVIEVPANDDTRRPSTYSR
jgi:hypothetical protein